MARQGAAGEGLLRTQRPDWTRRGDAGTARIDIAGIGRHGAERSDEAALRRHGTKCRLGSIGLAGKPHGSAALVALGGK